MALPVISQYLNTEYLISARGLYITENLNQNPGLMNRYRNIFTILFLFLAAVCANALNIRGRVFDNEHNPLAGVSCRLVLPSDSAYVSSAMTDTDGYFDIKADEDREYLLLLSSIGFEKTSASCRPGTDVEIIMNPDPTSLGEVVVKGSLKHNDALAETFFLTDSLRRNSNNSLQLLDKLGGITVDWASDAVKIGEYRDVPLMLNGRDVGKELIRNLAPGRIKKIELLRFPKGKYGNIPIVLNIVTYDNYLGYEAGVQAKGLLSFRSPASHNESLGADFIYTMPEWNVYGGVGADGKKKYEATAYSYRYDDRVVEATSKEDYHNPNLSDDKHALNLNLGTDYKIADGHVVSLQTWLDGGKSVSNEKYQTPQNTLLYDGNDRYRNINSTSGLYYKGVISGKTFITSDLTYNYYNVSERRRHREASGTSELNYTGRKNYWRYNLNATRQWSRVVTSNLGYTYTDRSYRNKDRDTDELLFRSYERRHDVYALLMVNPHPKVSLAVGSNLLFVDRDNGLSSDSRCSWMPSAKLYWQAPGGVSLAGNYYCDVEYPNLDQLSTVEYSKNQILMFRGNPELKERVMHYMEWRLKIPKVVEFTYMLRHSANDITPWYLLEKDYAVETLAGSRYLHQYIGASGDYSITRQLQMNFTASYQWYGRKGPEGVSHKGRTWYLDAMATYCVVPSLYLIAAYFLRHDKLPLLQGEEYGQDEKLMLGVMSPLCKGRLSLGVNFLIPTSLVSKRTYQDIAIPGFNYTSWRDDRVNNAMVQVSLRYNFGKGSATRPGNRNRSESEKAF